jgi:hypothetical protein
VAKLQALPEVKADIQALPSRRLQEVALSKIDALRCGRLQGQPLHKQVQTGDLSDCRKVYFDVRADRPPAWRIVYRQLTEDRLEIIEVVAVGARAGSVVYSEAVDRLGRR